MGELQELIALDEGYNIEFKVRVDKSQSDEIYAFANATKNRYYGVANKLRQVMTNKEDSFEN